jgi:hypothetical protein
MTCQSLDPQPILTITSTAPLKPSTRKNSKETIETTKGLTNKSLKDTLWIEEAAPVECNLFFNISDKPRKEGGGRGNIGNLHDEKIKDKYIKEG